MSTPTSTSPQKPMPAETLSPLGGPRFWGALALFWVFFGFSIGTHLVFSMRSHGHDGIRIVLWQIGGASAWILLTPAVLALERRLSVRSGLRGIVVHSVAAVLFAMVRLVPLTALSRRMDPFRPVAREPTFLAEYRALAAEWILLDVLVYVGILVLAAYLESRREQLRSRLRAAQLKAELSAARLRALELEIRPHFLFNALHTIHGLVRSGDRERASETLVSLADLLRATLKETDSQLVPLDEELELVELYLAIQKTRFSDRLAVEIDVAADARRALVPVLILQPLVENAIRHGVERSSAAGQLTLRARVEGQRLVLEVLDDGPGLSKKGHEGVGLSNVQSRLEALYEGRARFALDPAPGGGTRALVEIPIVDRKAPR